MEVNNVKLILAPFCADSVLLYHRLLRDGRPAWGFFDKNPLKEDKAYCGCYIRRIYWQADTKVVICHQGFAEEIVCELKTAGYTEDDILRMEDIQTETDEYQAACDTNLERFRELVPAHYVLGDSSGWIKLRKLKKLKELGAPTSELNYERLKFSPEGGGFQYENYIDSSGEKRIFLHRIEVDIGPACSLRCRYCANLMQYFEHPYLIPPEEVIRDYNRMMELIEWTDDILLLGGEPFVHKELYKVLDAIHRHPDTARKVGRRLIVTNGTIVPDERTMDSIAADDFIVWISNYHEHSRRLGELVRALQKRSIPFSVNNQKWVYTNQLEPPEKPDWERLAEIREACITRHRAVGHGKFFLCCFLNGAEKLRAIPANPENYVDIYAEDAREKLYDYMARSMPMPEGCLWCSGNFLEAWRSRQIPTAEQTEKPLPYTKYADNL